MAKGSHSQSSSSRKRGGPSNRRGKSNKKSGPPSHRSQRTEPDSFRPDSAIDEVDADHSGEEEDGGSGEESQVQIEVPVAMWVSPISFLMFGGLRLGNRTLTIAIREDVLGNVWRERD